MEPQYEPDQIRTLHDNEMRQRAPATRGTWLIAAVLAVIIVTWVAAVYLGPRATDPLRPTTQEQRSTGHQR